MSDFAANYGATDLPTEEPAPTHQPEPQPAPEPERAQPVEQEVIPPASTEASGGYARDGAAIPGAAQSLGQFFDVIEDGYFSQDAYEQIKDAVATASDMAGHTGNKQKVKVKLELDLEVELGAGVKIMGKCDVKKPEQPRRKSVLWTDRDNNFTRFPPSQTQMFGLSHARQKPVSIR